MNWPYLLFSCLLLLIIVTQICAYMYYIFIYIDLLGMRACLIEFKYLASLAIFVYAYVYVYLMRANNDKAREDRETKSQKEWDRERKKMEKPIKLIVCCHLAAMPNVQLCCQTDANDGEKQSCMGAIICSLQFTFYKHIIHFFLSFSRAPISFINFISS